MTTLFINSRTEESFRQVYNINSNSDYMKIIKSLQKIAQEEKDKRIYAEQELTQFKFRAIRRQAQLSRLVTKLKNYNNTLVAQNPQITKLFQTIWDNFDEFNRQTMAILEQNYDENQKSMSRKVNSIIQTMKQQLLKHEKKTNINHDDIKSELSVIMLLANKVEQRNIEYAQQIKRLQFEIKILKDQKQLIIQDALNRKRKVNELKQMNKKLLEESEKDMLSTNEHYHKHNQSIKYTSKDMGSNQIGTPMKRMRSKVESKNNLVNKNKSEVYSLQKMMQNHNLRMSTLDYYKEKNNNLTAQMNNSNSQLVKRVKTPVKNYLTITDRQTKRAAQKKINKSSLNSLDAKNTVSLFNQILDSPIMNTEQVQKPSAKKREKNDQFKEMHYINTIENLQKCLKREKGRVLSLGSVVTQISQKSKQINDALQEILRDAEGSPDKLQSIRQSHKLFKALKVIKQRLSALEKPEINCGWGDSIPLIEQISKNIVD